MNPAGGVQSIDLFQSNGRLIVSEENEIVPSFVQITNQTKNGKQFVSMCWPGSESECFLTTFLSCEDNLVRSCFCLSPPATTDETMYELFAPMIRSAGNKDEQFELMIWSVQHKTFVVAEITKAQQQHPTNRSLFILQPWYKFLF